MKKNYTSPAIETTEVIVEAGIAESTVNATFSLSGYNETEENYSSYWE